LSPPDDDSEDDIAEFCVSVDLKSKRIFFTVRNLRWLVLFELVVSAIAYLVLESGA